MILVRCWVHCLHSCAFHWSCRVGCRPVPQSTPSRPWWPGVQVALYPEDSTVCMCVGGLFFFSSPESLVPPTPHIHTNSHWHLRACLVRFCSVSLNLMTLSIASSKIYTSMGVPISVTGMAQVKIESTKEEMLAHACQQFLGKTEAQIKRVIMETLEGHQRAIMGECFGNSVCVCMCLGVFTCVHLCVFECVAFVTLWPSLLTIQHRRLISWQAP